jgi:hypothetical protein
MSLSDREYFSSFPATGSRQSLGGGHARVLSSTLEFNDAGREGRWCTARPQDMRATRSWRCLLPR